MLRYIIIRRLKLRGFSKNLKQLTDIINITLQAGVEQPALYHSIIHGEFLYKKSITAFLAEGEGFEPPGLLTQLFSRQPQ